MSTSHGNRAVQQNTQMPPVSFPVSQHQCVWEHLSALWHETIQAYPAQTQNIFFSLR